jgi:hypothetical protein
MPKRKKGALKKTVTVCDSTAHRPSNARARASTPHARCRGSWKQSVDVERTDGGGDKGGGGKGRRRNPRWRQAEAEGGVRVFSLAPSRPGPTPARPLRVSRNNPPSRHTSSASFSKACSAPRNPRTRARPDSPAGAAVGRLRKESEWRELEGRARREGVDWKEGRAARRVCLTPAF